jgi:tripartite motif-containing protein 71
MIGSGNGQFNRPPGVAVEDIGNVYVVDHDNNRVQKFNTNGTFITTWRTSGSGNEQFNRPVGVAATPC